MTTRSKENLIYGFIVLGSAAFLLWVIPAFTPPYPGYGVAASLLPNVAVGIMLALALLGLARNLLVQAFKKPENTEESSKQRPKDADKVHLWHLVRFMIPCLLMMPAMQWVGFIPAGLAFMLVVQYLCGQRKPVTAVLVAVGLVGITYVIIRYGLGVPMP